MMSVIPFEEPSLNGYVRMVFIKEAHLLGDEFTTFGSINQDKTISITPLLSMIDLFW